MLLLTMNNTFAENLAHYRVLAGLTQNDLAEKVGITKTQISRYETGNSMARPNVVAALANTLNVSTRDLLGSSTIIQDIRESLRLKRIGLSTIADDLDKSMHTITQLFSANRLSNTQLALLYQIVDRYKLPYIIDLEKGAISSTQQISVNNTKEANKKLPQELTIRITGMTKDHTYTSSMIISPSSTNDASCNLEYDIKNALLKYLQSKSTGMDKEKMILTKFDLNQINIIFRSDDDQLDLDFDNQD